MSIHSDKVAEVKYHGGMMALLSFSSTVAAKEFLENKANWENMFRWLRMGEEINDIQFERVAWIRIVGLPIKYWCEHNFSEIIRSFGRIIATFNDIKDRVDMSCVKIGILTRWKKKLNEEVKVVLKGITDTVGIVEYEDSPWFPFMFDKEKQPYVNEDDSSDNEQTEDETDEEGSDEEGGISDTDMSMPEEGEIIPDDNTVAGDTDVGWVNIPESVAETQTPASLLQPIPEGTGTIEKRKSPSTREELSSPQIISEPCKNSNWVNRPNHQFDSGKIIINEQEPFGLLKELALTGCFGPFPPNTPGPIPATPKSDENNQNSEAGRSTLKRKRTHRSPVSVTIPFQNEELDKNPTKSNEAEITAAIGCSIGFELESSKPVLADVLGNSGENNVAQ